MKIPLAWPVCTSTDILRTLHKLKANLEKILKYLLSTFYLLKKLHREKNIPEEENIKLLMKNTKKSLNFYFHKYFLLNFFFFFFDKKTLFW